MEMLSQYGNDRLPGFEQYISERMCYVIPLKYIFCQVFKGLLPIWPIDITSDDSWKDPNDGYWVRQTRAGDFRCFGESDFLTSILYDASVYT